ncbi:MAG: DNA recombination protein RmuC [bacterium]|nr:DNA recombination protein RmuC [bacterium]
MSGRELLEILSGALAGAGIVWLLLRARSAAAQVREAEQARRLNELQTTLAAREQELVAQREQVSALRATRAELDMQLAKEREAAQEKLQLLAHAQQQLTEAFNSLSKQALTQNSSDFLKLANETLLRYQEAAKGDLQQRQQAIEQLVKPMRESLLQFDGKVQELEKQRVGAYHGLLEQVQMLKETQLQLRDRTDNLVRALGTPHVRGRWGEIQLRRVVELAGMLNFCDFHEQASTSTEDGRLRPDMLVRLPGGKTIVIDAKAPLAALLEALEAKDDAVRAGKLRDHARQLREHVKALSQKSYWDQFQPAPEFVILFLPGETFFNAALEQDPALIEHGVEQRVIIATPTTLIALLKAVAYGWRQEALADNAQKISDLGKELYTRLGTMREHLGAVGAALQRAVEKYNQALGSFETRVLVSARRFEELEATGTAADLDPLLPVEASPRQLT